MFKKLSIKSWRKMVVVFLTLIFVCSTVSLLTSIRSYQNQINQTYINKDSYTCDKWISNMDARLNLIYEQIYDVFVTLFDDTEFQKNPNEIDTFTAKRIVELLQKKTMASNDISGIFLFDENSDYYTYVANSKSTIVKYPMVKSYLKEICVSDYSSTSDHSWSIKQIGGKKYFYKCIKIGRFYVGTVSECDLYQMKTSQEESDTVVMVSDGEITALNEDENFLKYASVENTENIDGYVVVTIIGENSHVRGTLVAKHHSREIIFSNIFLLMNATLEIILIAILFVYIKNRILNQTNDLIVATQEVSKGNFDYRIEMDDVGSDEFTELYSNFNNMTSQIKDLKIEQYDLKLKEEENKLRMLRGQLKPHTFLNGIATISNLTYDTDAEILREYIYQFSRFTKYMLNTTDTWISVKDELKQIENYIEMQKIKFPNSIDYAFSVEKGVEEVQIPYLMLFSQVENSFKHAMSLVQTLHINIRCERYNTENFKGIRLIEEDDGDGFSQEAFNKVKMNTNMFTKEHIGLTNTKYTLYILYKREDLLHISNKESGGARVEILIPEKGNEDETVNMRG